MIGLGRAVGAGSDFVILGVVGLSSADVLKCIHLSATLSTVDSLLATRGLTVALSGTRVAVDQLLATRSTSDALSAARTTIDALSGDVGEQC